MRRGPKTFKTGQRCRWGGTLAAGAACCTQEMPSPALQQRFDRACCSFVCHAPLPPPASPAPADPQLDPGQAALSALKREVRLLRGENAYLREQLLQASLPRGQPALPAASHPSASSLGAVPGMPGNPGGQELPAAGPAAEGPTRPASGAGAALEAAAGSGGAAPSPEELMRRLLDTQRMLVQFSRENDRLAGENGRLRSGRALFSDDYQGELQLPCGCCSGTAPSCFQAVPLADDASRPAGRAGTYEPMRSRCLEPGSGAAGCSLAGWRRCGADWVQKGRPRHLPLASVCAVTERAACRRPGGGRLAAR